MLTPTLAWGSNNQQPQQPQPGGNAWKPGGSNQPAPQPAPTYARGADVFPPNGPHSIAVNSSTDDVFVTNQADYSVTILDGNKNLTKVKLPVMTPGASMQVKVSQVDSSAVVLVDAPAGPGESDQLYKIFPQRGGGAQVDGPYALMPGDYKGSFAVDGDTGAIFAHCNRDGVMTRIQPGPLGRLLDPRTDKAEIQIGKGSTLIGFDAINKGVFTLNQDTRELRYIDPNSGPTDPQQVGSFGTHFQVAINPSSSSVGIINEQTNEFGRIRADQTVDVWNLPPGTHEVAAQTRNGAYIVSDREHNTVYAFPNDLKGGNAPLEVPVGQNPTHIMVDSEAENIGIVNEGDSSMTVIDRGGQPFPVASADVTVNGRTMPTMEKGSRSIAVNERTHDFYIANEATSTLTCVHPGGSQEIIPLV